MHNILGPSNPPNPNFRRPPELSQEIWKEEGLGEEREALGQLRDVWRERGRRGMLDLRLKRFKVWNFCRCSELPKKVRNFRRKSGTSGEISRTSEDSRET